MYGILYKIRIIVKDYKSIDSKLPLITNKLTIIYVVSFGFEVNVSEEQSSKLC